MSTSYHTSYSSLVLNAPAGPEKTLSVLVLCHKTFQSVADLTRHYNVHTNVKNHKCDLCSRYFGSISLLKSHQAAKHLNRKFSCEICPARFPYKSSLHNHIKSIHQEKKTFKCEKCPKKFEYQRTLTYHVQTIHEGLKPGYKKCTFCMKKLSPTSMSRHLRTVHNMS